jgi:hypothetical protein
MKLIRLPIPTQVFRQLTTDVLVLHPIDTYLACNSVSKFVSLAQVTHYCITSIILKRFQLIRDGNGNTSNYRQP